MMTGEDTIRLKIDVFTPSTLPMSRLADYLKSFAQMIGSDDSVHFVQVMAGSTELLASVDAPAIPKIRARTRALVDRTAPRLAIKAFQTVDNLLAEDNG